MLERAAVVIEANGWYTVFADMSWSVHDYISMQSIHILDAGTRYRFWHFNIHLAGLVGHRW